MKSIVQASIDRTHVKPLEATPEDLELPFDRAREMGVSLPREAKSAEVEVDEEIFHWRR